MAFDKTKPVTLSAVNSSIQRALAIAQHEAAVVALGADADCLLSHPRHHIAPKYGTLVPFPGTTKPACPFLLRAQRVSSESPTAQRLRLMGR